MYSLLKLFEYAPRVRRVDKTTTRLARLQYLPGLSAASRLKPAAIIHPTGALNIAGAWLIRIRFGGGGGTMLHLRGPIRGYYYILTNCSDLYITLKVDPATLIITRMVL